MFRRNDCIRIKYSYNYYEFNLNLDQIVEVCNGDKMSLFGPSLANEPKISELC